MIDPLNTAQHHNAEGARKDMHRREWVNRVMIYTFLGALFVALVVLSVTTYIGFNTRGGQIEAINEDLKTVCRVTPEKDAPVENTCAKAERNEIPGPQGAPGSTGPEGPQGPPGVPGSPGDDGTPGVAGRPGEDGSDGSTGTPGTQGEPGEDGAPGANGADGQPGPAGPPGSEGPAGPQGPAGEDGSDGEDGVGVASVDIGQDGGGCALTVTYTNGSIQSVSIPAAFCLPI